MSSVQYHSAGKRKNAVARVWLRPGEGNINVNERPLEDYFPRDVWKVQVKQPLEVCGLAGKYNVMANVYGGGLSGQAGAIRHGIARALLELDPKLRGRLRKEGLLTRDSRVKERKKYGQKGARRRFQYSKR
ncbi:MAG: 30S ribosomal protein S9 [Nitrospira sp.]|nr:30S ribosomal protein S9 [Nitrospira sp.]